ncbi:MAG: Fe-S cluster assembly protein HesB [Patescibacteria group bacterium]
MRLSKTQIIGFQKKIFIWWRKNKRDLPWRHTDDPYRIFVSEVMLQQTQVFRVVPKYRELVERYPTVTDLSRASTADVLRSWKGMGYNRRAVYLKKTAETVTRQYDGKFPTEEQSLRALPGVGSYTAAAIQVFAYKQDVAMVETNIRKIITHFFFNDIPQKEVIILDTARQLVPKGKSWQWHQALMDYGASSAPRRRGGEKSVVPFKLSDRFYRGKILDDLRETQHSMSTIQTKYHKVYALTLPKIRFLLDGLIKDGLIAVTKGIVHLPK